MEPLENGHQLKGRFPLLARIFARHWNTPLHQFAPGLYDKPPRTIESPLLTALREEWSELGYEDELIERGLDQLQQVPVLQTAHHVTPTHGPTFLAIDLISLAGLRDDQVYIVAANSGVAFSNSAWSGALSYGSLPLEKLIRRESAWFRRLQKADAERKTHGETQLRISLIPARQRDDLVFGYRTQPGDCDWMDHITSALRTLLPTPDPHQHYSSWAVRCAAQLQRRVLVRDRILVFDVNRVISRYLLKVLTASTPHPCRELLSNNPMSDRIMAAFDQPVLFLQSVQGKKSRKIDPLHRSGSVLIGRKKGAATVPIDTLVEALSKHQLCPALFILFFVLRYLNGIRCLGSFNQIEYLSDFRRLWEQLSTDWPLDLSQDEDNALTTGRCLADGHPLWPLDLALGDRIIDSADWTNRPMGHFWQPILDQLLRTATKI
jgi:hypothetical protein